MDEQQGISLPLVVQSFGNDWHILWIWDWSINISQELLWLVLVSLQCAIWISLSIQSINSIWFQFFCADGNRLIHRGVWWKIHITLLYYRVFWDCYIFLSSQLRNVAFSWFFIHNYFSYWVCCMFLSCWTLGPLRSSASRWSSPTFWLPFLLYPVTCKYLSYKLYI